MRQVDFHDRGRLPLGRAASGPSEPGVVLQSKGRAGLDCSRMKNFARSEMNDSVPFSESAPSCAFRNEGLWVFCGFYVDKGEMPY